MLNLDTKNWYSIKINYEDDKLIVLYRRDIEQIQENAKKLKEKLEKVKTVLASVQKTVELVNKLSP